MVVRKFRKKPVDIEAVQWKGHNEYEIKAFAGDKAKFKGDELYIKSLEGKVFASINSWIARGVKGEFYPIANDIFKETYYEVDETNG